MSWQASLILCGLALIAMIVAVCWMDARRKPFIPNREIDAYRITPKFNNDEGSA